MSVFFVVVADCFAITHVDTACFIFSDEIIENYNVVDARLP